MLRKKQVLTCLVLMASVMGTLLFLTAVAYEQSIARQSEQSAEFTETEEFREFINLFDEDSIAEEHIYIATRGFWNCFPALPVGHQDGISWALSDGTVLVYVLTSLLAAILWNSACSSQRGFRNCGLFLFTTGILGICDWPLHPVFVA